MAMNFSKPATTDNYSTGFVPGIQDNQAALAQWLDSGLVSITGTPPTGVKRYNRTSTALEEWSGSAWAPIPLHGLQFSATGLGLGAAPTANERFRVEGTEARIRSRNATSAAEVYLGAMNPNEARVWASTNTPLTFGTNNVEGMRLDTAGNLGIGGVPGIRGASIGNATRTGENYLRLLTSTTDTYIGQSSGSIFGLATGTVSFLAGNGAPLGVGTGTAHALIFGTNTLERARFDASGNFGLGVTSMAFKLDIAAPAGNGIRVTANSVQTVLGEQGSSGFCGTVTNHPLDFYTNSLRRATIDASGNMGLGNNAPGVTGLGVGHPTRTGANFVRAFTSTTDLYMGQSSGNVYGYASGAAAFFTAVGSPVGYGTSSAHEAVFGTNGLVRLGITADGRVYGTALHNNAGSLAGATNQYIASATYTPTLTNVANISASTPRKCTVVRVGNVVRVTGACSVTTVAGSGTATTLGISLPIASNLASGDLFGLSCFGSSPQNFQISLAADVTNDRASLFWASQSAGSTYDVTFDFSYEVLP